jgi:hypothetical protein
MSAPDFKTQLTERRKELRLPALRRCYEEKARQAERALGQELIRSGRRVAFTTCTRLVQELLLAKTDCG